jgi:hypothetical protein
MKIYNEITLEWNEDTKRYDNVVSEDSFEYDGELELAQYGTFAPAGRLKAGTMGRQTQWDLIDAAEEQAEKQAGHFGLGSILSFVTSAIMTSMGVPYPVAKGITDSLVAATYKPETYKSKTGWGTKRYEQLGERGERAKSEGLERAGTGFAQNMLLSWAYPELFGGVEDKLKGWKNKLFGDDEVIELAEDASTQPMTSLGGKASTAQSFDTKLDWVRDVLGGDVTGGRPARGGYNLASSSLEGAVPGMEFGGRTALGGGPVPFSLQDSRSALPAESLASVFGGPLGGEAYKRGPLGGNLGEFSGANADWYRFAAPELGFPKQRPLQLLEQFGLSKPPSPYEPPMSQGIQQSRAPWQGFRGVPFQLGR